MRMSPFSKVGMSPSGRVGDMNGRGDFGDEFGGARTAGGDWAGREQGFAAGAGSGAAGALRSAGETACSGLSRTGRRRSGFAPAGADVESSFGRRRDGPGEGLSSGQVQGFRPDAGGGEAGGTGRDRGRRCALIVFIDDATGRLTALQFAPCETTRAYLRALRSHVVAHGCPLAFYSDRHGIFRVNAKDPVGGDGKTEFGRVAERLRIELITALTPQAKGRVERANQTLQDRLVR